MEIQDVIEYLSCLLFATCYMQKLHLDISYNVNYHSSYHSENSISDLPKINLQIWTKVKCKQCKRLNYPKNVFQDEKKRYNGWK